MHVGGKESMHAMHLVHSERMCAGNLFGGDGLQHLLTGRLPTRPFGSKLVLCLRKIFTFPNSFLSYPFIII